MWAAPLLSLKPGWSKREGGGSSTTGIPSTSHPPGQKLCPHPSMMACPTVSQNKPFFPEVALPGCFVTAV